jgi:hypothetical protein
MKTRRKQFLFLTGGLLLPVLVLAADPPTKAGGSQGMDQTQPMSPSKPMGSPESAGKPGATGPGGTGLAADSSRIVQRQDEMKRLETALQPGQSKAFYRRELDRLGYNVTSVNKDRPDYVEYEVVKSETSYEVQIAVDKGSGKATKVEIEPNVWKARSTQQAVDKAKTPQ